MGVQRETVNLPKIAGPRPTEQCERWAEQLWKAKNARAWITISGQVRDADGDKCSLQIATTILHLLAPSHCSLGSNSALFIPKNDSNYQLLFHHLLSVPSHYQRSNFPLWFCPKLHSLALILTCFSPLTSSFEYSLTANISSQAKLLWGSFSLHNYATVSSITLQGNLDFRPPQIPTLHPCIHTLYTYIHVSIHCEETFWTDSISYTKQESQQYWTVLSVQFRKT